MIPLHAPTYAYLRYEGYFPGFADVYLRYEGYPPKYNASKTACHRGRYAVLAELYLW